MVQVGLAEQSLQRWVAAENTEPWPVAVRCMVAKFRNVIDAALTTVRDHRSPGDHWACGALVSVAGVSKGTLQSTKYG